MATRPAIHDTTIKFRANAKLAASLTDRARNRGMTLAELLRSAARRELLDADS